MSHKHEITFKIIPDTELGGVQACQVLHNGRMIAMLYGGDNPKTLRIVSAHFKTENNDPHGKIIANTNNGLSRVDWPIPIMELFFDPQTYNIENGRIVRLERCPNCDDTGKRQFQGVDLPCWCHRGDELDFDHPVFGKIKGKELREKLS